MDPLGPLRLYRGLSRLYRPEDVGVHQGELAGTDFTDCALALPCSTRVDRAAACSCSTCQRPRDAV